MKAPYTSGPVWPKQVTPRPSRAAAIAKLVLPPTSQLLCGGLLATSWLYSARRPSCSFGGSALTCGGSGGVREAQCAGDVRRGSARCGRRTRLLHDVDAQVGQRHHVARAARAARRLRGCGGGAFAARVAVARRLRRRSAPRVPAHAAGAGAAGRWRKRHRPAQRWPRQRWPQHARFPRRCAPAARRFGPRRGLGSAGGVRAVYRRLRCAAKPRLSPAIVPYSANSHMPRRAKPKLARIGTTRDVAQQRRAPGSVLRPRACLSAGPEAVARGAGGRCGRASQCPRRRLRPATRTPSTTRSWTTTDGCVAVQESNLPRVQRAAQR